MSRLHRSAVALACAVLVAPSLRAQMAAENPLTAALVDLRAQAKHYVTININTMPESKYGYRASPKSLTFAQILGHITDYEYIWCAQGKGVPNPHTGSDEKTVTTKAQAVAGLDSAWTYCNGLFAGMTDQHLADVVPFSLLGGANGAPKPKLTVLVMTIQHMMEHFGQGLAYMEMNGLEFPHAPPPPKTGQ